MRKDLNIFDFLAQIPWWVSISLSASFYVFLKYVIPLIESNGTLVNEVHVSLGPVLAPVVALAFLSPVTFSFLKSNRKKRYHDLRGEIGTIQELSWKQFNQWAAEAFEQAGYMILDYDPYNSDPSIDFVMRKSANLYLVQTRYWRNRKLGLREVKKLYSIMQDKQASGIFLLTTGIFTRDARRFSVGRPINLVDGIALVELLEKNQKKELNPGVIQ